MVQKEKGTVTPIYGILIESDEDQWKADVEYAAKGAWAILLFPSSSGCSGQVQPDTFLKEFSNSIGDWSKLAECSRSTL